MVKKIHNKVNDRCDFWEMYGNDELGGCGTYYFDNTRNLWKYTQNLKLSGVLLSIERDQRVFPNSHDNLTFNNLNDLLSNKNFRICLIYDKKYILLSENYRFEEIKILKKETGIQDAIDGNCDFIKSFGIRDLNTMKWVFYDNDWYEKETENKDNEKQVIRCYKGQKDFSEKCDSCCSAGDKDICSFDPLWKTSLELENEIRENKKQDNINHPSHYTQGKIECIDYIMDKMPSQGFEGFCQGNILKYVTRYKYKNGIEDLKKAIWYINKLIETLENIEEDD